MYSGFSSEDTMRLRDEQVRSLLNASRETRDLEIDCGDFLSLMAEYAEVRAEGRAVPEGLEKACAHERLCASCREELAALVEIVSGARR
jgi:hypothetical protein